MKAKFNVITTSMMYVLRLRHRRAAERIIVASYQARANPIAWDCRHAISVEERPVVGEREGKLGAAARWNMVIGSSAIMLTASIEDTQIAGI